MQKKAKTGPLRSVTPEIDIYIRLAQYPILCNKIRMRMREELFRRGIISQAKFEREVTELAVKSRIREGLGDPSGLEEESTWEKRKSRVREVHTDSIFATNLGSALLEQLIQETLQNQPAGLLPERLTFNPEISPWEILFQQGEIYERTPQPKQAAIKHHLEEIKVALIRRIISDQLPFIGLARQVLTVADLQRIYRRLIGTGKIGGKAAGMVLAWKMLQKSDPDVGPDISQAVTMPDSHYIGSEVIYEFVLRNELENFVTQKYQPLTEMKAAYPHIVASMLKGAFSEQLVEDLRDYLLRVGDSPLIVRSSSLLEDSFSYPFSGRYESQLCPNQGTLEDNLDDLLAGIRRVFASIFNPKAMVDRRKHGLIDYDERMAALLQRVDGERYGRYFFPPVSGVAFSHFVDPWDAQIRPEEGMMRLVAGLGIRANEVGQTIALSHPRLRPSADEAALVTPAQQRIDLVDLEQNRLTAVPVQEILQSDYPYLPYIASPAQPNADKGMAAPLTLTFDYLTQDWKFIKLIRTALMRLESEYQKPVKIEFSVKILPGTAAPEYKLCILQCHPFQK